MRVSISVLALALAALASNVLAVSIEHRHAHAHDKRGEKMNQAIVYTTTTTTVAPTPSAATSSAVAPSQPASSGQPSNSGSNSGSKPINSWVTDLTSVLNGLGFKCPGANPTSNNGAVWLGSGGTYTNNFINNASETVILVIWGREGSWVNAVEPLITKVIEPGESQVVSFADGQSGAWSGIYSDTKLVNGQVCETWGEYTFSGSWSTVDVSREVNMSGKGMEIRTPQCVTNMETCVFVCNSGNSCLTDYSLLNCAVGSQPGANYGTADYGGGPVPSGGCSGMGSSAELITFFMN
jgi:hypothetical protein